jgi:hypothetical protein
MDAVHLSLCGLGQANKVIGRQPGGAARQNQSPLKRTKVPKPVVQRKPWRPRVAVCPHPGFTFDLSLETVRRHIRCESKDAVPPLWEVAFEIFEGVLQPPRGRDDYNHIRMIGQPIFEQRRFAKQWQFLGRRIRVQDTIKVQKQNQRGVQG